MFCKQRNTRHAQTCYFDEPKEAALMKENQEALSNQKKMKGLLCQKD